MNRNRVIRPVITLAAAALAVALGTAGLAVAGVNLPDPAQEALENAGISLPNQAGGSESGEHARSEGVHAVIGATPPSERGCAFGHSVAEAAKGSSLPEQAQDACDKGEQNGAEATAKAKSNSSSSSHSEFGCDTPERAKGQKDVTVDERRSFGEEIGRAGEGARGRAGREPRRSAARGDPGRRRYDRCARGHTEWPARGHAPRHSRGHADRAAEGTPSGRP